MPAATGEVLIVDGDPAVRRLLEVVVQTLPRKAVLAADGRRAIALLGGRTFDAVVMDLALPDGAGPRVLEEMESRRPEQLRHTVILTDVPESGRRTCRQVQAVAAVLCKPFALGALQQALRECCTRARESVCV
jgi:CheY-like chemotaxis protein